MKQMKQSKKRTKTTRIRTRITRRSKSKHKKVQNLIMSILVLINLIGTTYGTIKISRQQLLTQDSSVLTKILVTLVSFITGMGIGMGSSKLLLNLTEGFHDLEKIEDIDSLENNINQTLRN